MLYRSMDEASANDEDGKSKLTRVCLCVLASTIRCGEWHLGLERNQLVQQLASRDWGSWRRATLASPSWLWSRTSSGQSCTSWAEIAVRNTSPGGFYYFELYNCANVMVSLNGILIYLLMTNSFRFITEPWGTLQVSATGAELPLGVVPR